VKAARIVAKGNRIEYRRSNIIEWYVNNANGLEQGFTLAAPMGRPIPRVIVWAKRDGELDP
jgi:hypothetical protein